MIPRYTRPEMAAIWSPQARYRIWFEIEAHAADAMAELGIIPRSAAETIWAKGKHATFDDRSDVNAGLQFECRHSSDIFNEFLEKSLETSERPCYLSRYTV